MQSSAVSSTLPTLEETPVSQIVDDDEMEDVIFDNVNINVNESRYNLWSKAPIIETEEDIEESPVNLEESNIDPEDL